MAYEKKKFDPAKDRKLWEHELSQTENNSLLIGKYVYDNGPEKIGISRIFKTTNRDNQPVTYHNPLGRFTMEEFIQFSSVISEKEGI